MTVKQLENRINRLRPSRIVLPARMPDGTEREMSAPEYVEAVKLEPTLSGHRLPANVLLRLLTVKPFLPYGIGPGRSGKTADGSTQEDIL